jgi:hypothetical protein
MDLDNVRLPSEYILGLHPISIRPEFQASLTSAVTPIIQTRINPYIFADAGLQSRYRVPGPNKLTATRIRSFPLSGAPNIKFRAPQMA